MGLFVEAGSGAGAGAGIGGGAKVDISGKGGGADMVGGPTGEDAIVLKTSITEPMDDMRSALLSTLTGSVD